MTQLSLGAGPLPTAHSALLSSIASKASRGGETKRREKRAEPKTTLEVGDARVAGTGMTVTGFPHASNRKVTGRAPQRTRLASGGSA